MLLVTDFWQWYLAGSLWTPPTVCLCVSKTIRRNYLIFPDATRKKIFPVVFVKSEFLEISAVYRLARKKSFRTLWKFRVNKPYRPKRNSNGTKRGQRSFGKTIPLVAHVSRRSSHIVNCCPRRVVQKYCTCSCLTHATWFGFHTGDTHDTPWFNATSSSANYDSSTVAIDSDDVYGNSPSNCD